MASLPEDHQRHTRLNKVGYRPFSTTDNVTHQAASLNWELRVAAFHFNVFGVYTSSWGARTPIEPQANCSFWTLSYRFPLTPWAIGDQR
jgi:hypothetical protein